MSKSYHQVSASNSVQHAGTGNRSTVSCSYQRTVNTAVNLDALRLLENDSDASYISFHAGIAFVVIIPIQLLQL